MIQRAISELHISQRNRLALDRLQSNDPSAGDVTESPAIEQLMNGVALQAQILDLESQLAAKVAHDPTTASGVNNDGDNEAQSQALGRMEMALREAQRDLARARSDRVATESAPETKGPQGSRQVLKEYPEIFQREAEEKTGKDA